MDAEVLLPPPALASVPARTSAPPLAPAPARAAPGVGTAKLRKVTTVAGSSTVPGRGLGGGVPSGAAHGGSVGGSSAGR